MVTRGSAVYEAELIDKVTAPAAHIVAALGKLEAAFNSINAPAARVAASLNTVSSSMKTISSATQMNAGWSKLGQSFNRASETVSQLGTAIGRGLELIGVGMQRAGAAGIAATTVIAAGLYSTIEAASKATETLNAFEAVLGSSGKTLQKTSAWAKDFSENIGRSEVKTQEALISFTALFKGLGVGTNLASGLAKKMTALSVDFASFFNLSDDESLQRFISALSGSSEVLDKFGINIRENALEQRALELGLGGNIRKMSELGKTLVRAHIIAGVMKDDFSAVGDALRTSMEWANQVKALGAAFEKLQVAVGTLAIKELKPTLLAINSAFKQLSKTVSKLGSAGMKTFVNGLLALAGTSAALIALGTAIAGIGSAIAIAALALAGFLTTLGAAVAGGPVGMSILAFTTLTVAIASFALAVAAINLPFQKMFDSLKKGFGELSKTVEDARAVITRAMQAGDWDTAWQGFVIAGELAFIQLAQTFIKVMTLAVNSVAKTIYEDLNLTNIIAKQVAGSLSGQNVGRSLNPFVNMQNDLQKRSEDLQGTLGKMKFKQDTASFVPAEIEAGIKTSQDNLAKLKAERVDLQKKQSVDKAELAKTKVDPRRIPRWYQDLKTAVDDRVFALSLNQEKINKAEQDVAKANKGPLNIGLAFENMINAQDALKKLETERTKLNSELEVFQKNPPKPGSLMGDPEQVTARKELSTNLDKNTKATDIAKADLQSAKDTYKIASANVDKFETTPSRGYFLNMGPDALQASIDAEKAKAKNKFQVGSIGTFQASVAQNFDRFLPTFDPLLDQAVKTNTTLTSIDKKMDLLTEQAVF